MSESTKPSVLRSVPFWFVVGVMLVLALFLIIMGREIQTLVAANERLQLEKLQFEEDFRAQAEKKFEEAKRSGLQAALKAFEEGRDEEVAKSKMLIQPLIDGVVKEKEELDKKLDEMKELHRNQEGFELLDSEYFTLYLPHASRGFYPKEQAAVEAASAYASVVLAFGKFERKVKIRLTTSTALHKTDELFAQGMFLRDGDEVLVALSQDPKTRGLTLRHELVHAWIWQHYGERVPSPLNEGIAYCASGELPSEMFKRLETYGGTLDKSLLSRPFLADPKKRIQVEANAWLVVYYLICVRGFELKEVVRMDPTTLPAPADVFSAAWVHHLLHHDDLSILSRSGPFNNRWLDLAEVGPLTVDEIKRFDRQDPTSIRRMWLTKELFHYDLGKKQQLPVRSYSVWKKFPDFPELWKASRPEVYQEMFREMGGESQKFPYGVSLGHLLTTILHPLVSKEEFAKSGPSSELRSRCEATLWAYSFVSIFSDGKPHDPWTNENFEMLDLKLLRRRAVGDALGRIVIEVQKNPLNLLKLR